MMSEMEIEDGIVCITKQYACFSTGESNVTPAFTTLKLTLVHYNDDIKHRLFQ